MKKNFNMSEYTLRVLGFDKILEAISRFSHSDATSQSIQKIRPLNDREAIEKRFALTKEILKLYHKGIPLNLYSFEDLAPLIEKLKPEGAMLEAYELFSFIPVLRMISDLSGQINERDDMPFLKDLITDMSGFPEILSLLKKSVDSEGNILDSASPLLSRLRAEIRSLERNIKKSLEKKMLDNHIAPFLQDNFITQRAGRWVIPVRMDSKGQVPGVVHDISRSGETAFIEPLEIIGLTNELENLIADAKTEEIKILKAISHRLRNSINEISAQYETVVYLDTLNSIARFADLLKMEIPLISDSLSIRLVKARHPLLELLRINKSLGNVVPLDLELGGETTAMVITGPNAGGKTIAIKTVGLLLLMALSGIPVPADSMSSFPFVTQLLVDIGDEQSIEESLSTFSAHISKISQIIKTAGENTVVLLDELGTGTEPSQGAAIACSVLKALEEKKSLIFATTHLMDIVSFVYRTKGMLNASMDFDTENLTPLYRLRTGEPGQSHALEIAMRYGLSENIINSAKEFLGNINVELYDLIADLKEKRNKYEESLHALENTREELEHKQKLLDGKLYEFEKMKKEVEENSYKEAQKIIMTTKQQMRALLEEAKQKERASLKEAEKLQKEIAEKLKSFQKDTPVSIDDIKDGDIVFVRSIGCDATVNGIDKRHERLRITAGNMDIEVSVSDITLKKGITRDSKPADAKEDQEKNITARINLIGLRVDEAISRLEPFLNHATLDGLDEVIIIHGLGTGTLRRAVHEHLTSHPLIKKFRSGEINEGGKGVTVATLN